MEAFTEKHEFAHGHGHGHSHGNGHVHAHPHNSFDETSDIWTKLSALGELTTSLISDAYWIASLFELVVGNEHEQNAVSLSWTAFALGTSIAVFTALGATYSHWHLNLKNQHHHSTSEAHYRNLDAPEEAKQRSLSKMQYFALACDWVSHTGDVAGPIAFVVDLMSKGQLTVQHKAIVYCSATLFGAVSSYADVRTCRMHMKPSEQSESVGLDNT